MDKTTGKRRLAINLAANAIAFAVNFGISFFLTPYIISTVGSEAYGFVKIATDFVSYAMIVTVALNSMAGRFITIEVHRDNEQAANEYFNSVLIANIVIAAALLIPAALCVVFAERLIEIPPALILDVKWTFCFTFLNFLVGIVASVFGVATFVTNRLDLASRRNIESYVIRVVSIVALFALFPAKIAFVAFSALLATAYTIFANLYYTKKLLPQIKLSTAFYRIGKIKELIGTGVWNTVGKLGSLLSNGLDLLIANLFIGATAMGTLAISKTVPAFILTFFSMIASAFGPQITIYFAKEDWAGLKSNIKLSMTVLGLLSSIPVAVFLACGRSFYQLWVPSQNASLLQALSIACMLGLVFGGPVESLYSVYTAANKIKVNSLFNLSCSILTAAIVFTSMWFVQSEVLGMFIIAGVSALLSIVRNTIFMPLYAAHCLHFKWNTFYPPIIKNVVSIAAITLFSWAFAKLLPVNTWGILIVNAGTSALCGVVFNYLIVFTAEERAAIRRLIQNKLIRGKQA